MRQPSVCFLLLLMLAVLHQDELLLGSGLPETLAREGHLQQALDAYPEVLDASGGKVDPELVRGYLQVRHLNQSQPRSRAPACERGANTCRIARQLAKHYDIAARVDAGSGQPVRFHRGESGHAVVNLDTTDGRAAPMVLDTGSVATILPATLRILAEDSVAETRVANLGRIVPLMLVRSAPFAVGDVRFEEWITAVSDAGFEREGVIGLDVLHAVGGFSLDTESREVKFLHGACPASTSFPLTLEKGAPVAEVIIDGKPHRALIDTGSVRSFVFSPSAAAGLIRVGSDFGAATLRATERRSMIRIAGHERSADFIHVARIDHFYAGTTALIGLDVLLAGSGMSLCVEPMRFWLD
jgi:hypothetical protein